jgi:hypothetical protein
MGRGEDAHAGEEVAGEADREARHTRRPWQVSERVAELMKNPDDAALLTPAGMP